MIQPQTMIAKIIKASAAGIAPTGMYVRNEFIIGKLVEKYQTILA